MNRKQLAAAILLLVLGVALSLYGTSAEPYASDQNWTNYARIGAWGLKDKAEAERIVREAQTSRVFGIEVDNDIPGRYESFLDPKAVSYTHLRAHETPE